ncbi:hypothetical protein LTR95_009684 [Oleoguttula sp. CCFEE 5521]
MAPKRKKSRLNSQAPVNTDDQATYAATPVKETVAEGSNETVTRDNIHASNGAPPTPKSSRDTWYGAAWRSKASPLTETARESISVAQGVTSEALADAGRQIAESSRRPGHIMSKSMRGSRKSIPLVAEPTRVHAISDASDQSRPRAASGEKLKSLDGIAESKGESKSERHSATERKPVVLEEASLPPTPSIEVAGTEDAKSGMSAVRPQTWFGWWSRPDETDSTKHQEAAVTTPLPGTPEDEVAQPAIEPPSVQLAGDVPKAVPLEIEQSAPGTSSRSWFGLWSNAQNQQAAEDNTDAPESAAQQVDAAKRSPDVPGPTTNKAVAETEVSAIDATAAERPKSAGWAFWSQDKASKDETPTPGGTAKQVGELAVADTPSQSHPEAAQFNEQREPKSSKSLPSNVGGLSNPKRSKKGSNGAAAKDQTVPVPAIKPTADALARAEISNTQTSQAAKPATKSRPNLILPSFTESYGPAPNPTYIQQVGTWLAETLHINESLPAVPHVYISPNKAVVKKAISLGVHGFFPAPLIQKVLGQPTGTSIRFANSGAEAIKAWCQLNQPSVRDVSIEKVALEGEGLVGDRVNTLWKLMLNWLSHLRQADFILVNCHSQGVPVAVALVAKLIQLNCLAPNAKIGVCAMAGINLGPFLDYKSRLFGGSALELFDFCDSSSRVSQSYAESLDVCLRHGVRITYTGSLDDQLVSLESSLHCPLTHPYVNRAVFIDGRVHAPNFLTHLVIFATKLRNRGVSDHGLLRELSAPLAGSLVGGDGHSRVYDDLAVYRLAVDFALESTDVAIPAKLPSTTSPSSKPAFTRRTSISGYPPTTAAANKLRRGSAGDSLPGIGAVIAPYSAPKEANPFNLPWAVRGLLEEKLVKEEFGEEVMLLVKEFEEWKPTSKALRDVKFRLEGVKSMDTDIISIQHGTHNKPSMRPPKRSCTLKLRHLRLTRPWAPRNTTLRVHFKPRLDLRLHQIEVIDRTNPRDEQTRKARGDTIHQRAADRAEIVLHRVAACDSLRLSELGELVLASGVRGVALLDDEVGGEHRGCDFVVLSSRMSVTTLMRRSSGLLTVGTVADKAINEPRRLRRLRWSAIIDRVMTDKMSYE